VLYVQDHSSDCSHFTLSASGLRLALGTVLTARSLVTALALNLTIASPSKVTATLISNLCLMCVGFCPDFLVFELFMSLHA
jgi:hypothetical protein